MVMKTAKEDDKPWLTYSRRLKRTDTKEETKQKPKKCPKSASQKPCKPRGRRSATAKANCVDLNVNSKPTIVFYKWHSENTTGEAFTKELFLIVWDRLSHLYNEKRMFALRWILRKEATVELFVTTVLDIPIGNRHIGKGVLSNGYYAVKRDLGLLSNGGLLDPLSWQHLQRVFEELKCFNLLPRPMKYFMGHLSRDDPLAYLEGVIKELRDSKQFSMEEQFVNCKPKLTRKTGKGKAQVYDKCFLGTWENSGYHLPDPDLRPFTSDFMVARTTKHCTFFVDKSGPEPLLVGMLLKSGTLLSESTRMLLRSYMEELFDGHPAIKRRNKPALADSMTAFGPFYNVYKGETNRVAFFTHKLKVHTLFPECGAAAQFDKVLDKYAHNEFIGILLGLYWWLCPEMLRELFAYSLPYMRKEQYEQTPIERLLDLGGPNLYQLYITKDYCSRIHQDRDAVPMTLCYCSNPDRRRVRVQPGDTLVGDGKAVDFVMVDHGLRIEVEDADMLAFRAPLRHATAYSAPSQHARYVGCVTVNNGLHNLLRRQQDSNV